MHTAAIKCWQRAQNHVMFYCSLIARRANSSCLHARSGLRVVLHHASCTCMQHVCKMNWQLNFSCKMYVGLSGPCHRLWQAGAGHLQRPC
jgi:hypothetical protein